MLELRRQSPNLNAHMSTNVLGNPNTNNQSVISWVQAQAKLCQPDNIFWCDGSVTEKELLTAEAVAKGILVKLNQEKLPGCYYHRSHPNDVARVEQCTFICTPMQ
jgi:phosphoenolpyruvate carboxykinase (GTP)